MLKDVPDIISPDLMHVMMSMGHGDELCIGDGNFPGAACGQRLVRLHGVGVPELLRAVVRFFPLDPFVDAPAQVMAVVGGDDTVPEIWNTYDEILKADANYPGKLGQIGRHDFYERAKNSFAVVMTSETALYANLLLTKGVVV